MPLVRMFTDDGRHYFAFRDPAGQWERYRVDYTIGSKWQQAYATRLPKGRIHVFPVQYSTVEKRWINFWKIIDDAGSERAVVGDFPKMNSDQLPAQLRALPHQPAPHRERPNRARGLPVSRTRRQLRDVPWAVGPACASDGDRQTPRQAADGAACRFQQHHSKRLRGDLRAMPQAVRRCRARR